MRPRQRPAIQGPSAASAAPLQASAGLARHRIRIVEGDLWHAVDEAQAALLAVGGFGIYQRGGGLVRPVLERVGAANGRETNIWRLLPVKPAFLAETLGRAALFEVFNHRAKDWRICDCPSNIVYTLLAREGVWDVPTIAGVVHTPFLRVDGSLCVTSGYDAASRLLFQPDGEEFPPIPVSPSKDDAAAALERVEALIETFPFVSSVDRAIALSMFLTAALDRRSLATAPLHAFTSPEAGTGKSMLVDLVSILLSGRPAAVTSQGRSEEEMEKRLNASLLAGEAVISIDNCSRPLEGVFLCQMLSQRYVNVRLLGYSLNINVPTSSLVTATGNNLAIAGDMTRRALLCTLDAECEHPELREFEQSAVRIFRNQRGAIVIDLLTILLAWHASGAEPEISPLGGFEDWSIRIRAPLLWLGAADPCGSMAHIRASDPFREELRAVILSWRDAFGVGRELAVQEIINDVLLNQDLNVALTAVAAGRNGFISNRSLGRWLKKVEGRVIGGFKLVSIGIRGGYPLWTLQISS